MAAVAVGTGPCGLGISGEMDVLWKVRGTLAEARRTGRLSSRAVTGT